MTLALAFALFLAVSMLALVAPPGARADEEPPITSELIVSPTPEPSEPTETTTPDDSSEAPMPTEIPGSSPTLTPVPASPAPSQTRSAPTNEAPGPSRTPVPTSTASPQPTAGGDGWQVNSLRDFAETVGWPPVVLLEANDRLSVRANTSADDWASASIRSFSFRAGSSAAFAAEQEDARLSGYQLSRDTFYTFPAYAGYKTGANGVVVERRYRWLVQSWVLGIDVRRPGVSSADVQALATQLLAVATQNGLPVPAGASDIPAPTPQNPAADTPEGCSTRFSDVPESMWAYNYITELACTGVVSGYGDGTFRPQSATTRAQLVKMVLLLQGIALDAPATATFNDVSLSHPFYRYIETAVRQGLITGYPDGSFKPDAPVSRAQVAKIVVKALGWGLQVPTSAATLCDVPASHWAYTYVQVALARGIFTGYGDGCFHPDDFATRAQLAKVLVLSGR
ncbi:MAG TPA: S-layer homology domain-containing protein [Chloroflexia bacterium]